MQTYTRLYLHIIWSTWDRQPLITEQIEEQLYATIADKCYRLNCEPLAIGGTLDYVHLLVRFPTTLSVAELAKEVKGVSSHLVTHVLRPGEFFKWQGGYGAFTLRKKDVPVVQRYIQRQKEHHQMGTEIAWMEFVET